MIDHHILFQALTHIVPPAHRSAELALALDVATAAGEQLLTTFGRVTGRPKPDGSPVTDADLAADALIAGRLNAAFPADAVLSEESTTTFGGESRVWVVDPLDGTSNYCHGVPLWGVSLALVERGRPVVAVSHFPCLRHTFWAVAGHGAWDGQRRLGAVASPAISDDDLVTFCSRMPRRFDLHLAGRGRMLGSETLSLALVAAGAVHASLAATVVKVRSP